MAQHPSTLPRAVQPTSPVRQPSRPVVLLHAGLGALVGLGMGSLVIGHLADFGSQAPLVQQMLALGSQQGAGSLQAVAVDSGSHLLRFAALVIATGSALALLFGAGLAVTESSGTRTAHRAIRIGLWMALAVCLLAMLPLDGQPFSLGYTRGDEGALAAAFQWHPVLRILAAGAAAGLLLSGVAFRRNLQIGAARP